MYGFEHGGFLVEAGKTDLQKLSPLVARLDFPESWRIVLVLSRRASGLHGPTEIEAFRHLSMLAP